MGTIASEHPRASARRPLTAGKNFNLRALFAGGAATVALIAAGVIVFGSLGAYVAFNGLPVGGGNDGSGSVAVTASPAAASASASAPARAAASLAAAPGAVAATPAAATAVAPAPGTAAADGATGTTAPGTAVTGTTGTTPTGTTPTGTTPTGTTPTTPSGSASTSSGPVGSAVQGLENTAAGAGVDLPLSETTQGLTDQVDQTVQGTLDGVGGVIGNPNLGQQVGGTVNNVTGPLLGN